MWPNCFLNAVLRAAYASDTSESNDIESVRSTSSEINVLNTNNEDDTIEEFFNTTFGENLHEISNFSLFKG